MDEAVEDLSKDLDNKEDVVTLQTEDVEDQIMLVLLVEDEVEAKPQPPDHLQNPPFSHNLDHNHSHQFPPFRTFDSVPYFDKSNPFYETKTSVLYLSSPRIDILLVTFPDVLSPNKNQKFRCFLPSQACIMLCAC